MPKSSDSHDTEDRIAEESRVISRFLRWIRRTSSTFTILVALCGAGAYQFTLQGRFQAENDTAHNDIKSDLTELKDQVTDLRAKVMLIVPHVAKE